MRSRRFDQFGTAIAIDQRDAWVDEGLHAAEASNPHQDVRPLPPDPFVLDPGRNPMRLPCRRDAGCQVHDGLTARHRGSDASRSEEHTSELQSLMRISYAVFCLKKKSTNKLLLKSHTN